MSECDLMEAMWDLLLRIEPFLETQEQRETLNAIAYDLLVEAYGAGCEPFDSWGDTKGNPEK